MFCDIVFYMQSWGKAPPHLGDRSRTSRQLEASHPHNKAHESKLASTLSVAPAGNMGIKKRVKSLGEKLIPISPEFYDTAPRDEDLVAPKNVLLPFNAFLMCSQWIAFAAMMWYYASPVNNVRLSTIQSDWGLQSPGLQLHPADGGLCLEQQVQLRHVHVAGAPRPRLRTRQLMMTPSSGMQS